MAALQERLNFAMNQHELDLHYTEGNTVLTFNMKHTENYPMYDNLCKYCADNDIVTIDYSNEDFDACVDLMKEYGSNNQRWHFWID